jgi:hypothetical protein
MKHQSPLAKVERPTGSGARVAGIERFYPRLLSPLLDSDFMSLGIVRTPVRASP